MAFPKKIYQIPVGDGREIAVEFGKLANLANGSCVATLGETSVLATAVIGEREVDLGYFPLMTNYEEKLFAAGMIKGSRFIKREGRPSDDIILSQRVIDRGLRPLFPDGIRRDVQVMLTTLSFDEENDHDMVASVAASVAVAVSDIPWDGPTGTVRVGRVDGKFVLNPTFENRDKSDLDLIVTSTAENVVMVEAGADEVSESDMLDALDFGKKAAQAIALEVKKIADEIGLPKQVFAAEELPAGLVELVRTESEAIAAALAETGKKAQNAGLKAAKTRLAEALADENHELFDAAGKLGDAFEKVKKEVLRAGIFEKETRPGGRGLAEIRPLESEAGVLPRVHGSALFQRGETQNLAVLTLGAPGDAQITEDLRGEHEKHFFHHYSFPPYAVGEASGRLFVNNRAIGHGALAERALRPMIPAHEDFPYTMRLVSNITTCNGSSSMASICGSSMALMDGGVPVRSAVAGIAMGLVANEKDRVYKVLSDIAGIEDACGDMDFKVAGTERGITALQLDTKISGLPREVFEKAFEQARVGRLEILKNMNAAIAAPRAEMAASAPRITSLKINPEQIGAVIGKGGETIRKIIAETGIETMDVEDSGLVFITAKSGPAAQAAEDWVKKLTWNPEVGDFVEGPITKIADFGVFVEIAPGRDAMCHISRLTGDRLARVEDSGVKLGDVYKYQVVEIDEARGKISLSKVAVDGGRYENGATPHSGGGAFGGDRGGRPGGHGGFHGGAHRAAGGHDRAGRGFHEKDHRGDPHAHKNPHDNDRRPAEPVEKPRGPEGEPDLGF